MNKRGQFYLVAAMVIISLIGGFAAVSNYMQTQDSIKIFDLKNELQIESGKVLEYGIAESVDVIEHFIDQYDEYAGENKEIYFVYGNKEEVTLITYDEIALGYLQLSGINPSTQVIEGREATTQTFEPQGSKVIITIDGIDYEFQIKPGENFFFIISQEIEGEQHVAIS